MAKALSCRLWIVFSSRFSLVSVVMCCSASESWFCKPLMRCIRADCTRCTTSEFRFKPPVIPAYRVVRPRNSADLEFSVVTEKVPSELFDDELNE